MIRILFLLTIVLSILQLSSQSCDIPTPLKAADFCPLADAPPIIKSPIRKLNTIFNLFTNPKKLSAKFSVYNRRHQVVGIPFVPDETYPLQDPVLESKLCFDTNSKHHHDLERMGKEGYDPRQRTIVIIPGFLTGEHEAWMETAKDLWLELEDVNVVLVSWKDGNSFPYHVAAANTPIVGRQVAIFLHYLADRFNTKVKKRFASKIHIFGHSLGAHIAGFAGKDFEDTPIGRITGLDPAGPTFDKMDKLHRLDRADAKLVEAIHTNAGKIHYANSASSFIVKGLVKGVDMIPWLGEKLARSMELQNYTYEGDTTWYGLDEDIAHIDYYAHNGRVQPGCNDLLHICDHTRATQIFVDLLNYELRLRKLDSARGNLKQHRILAFKSDDFDAFNNGENLSQHCPKVLDLKYALKSTDEIIDNCTIPLDLVAPVNELIEEYKSYYKIDFDWSGESESNRFFFKTLTTSDALIGDHYLLKVGIVPSLSSWNSDCSLKLELVMSDGSKSLVEVNKDSLSPTTLFGYYNGVATPFINNNTVKAREDLNYLLQIAQQADRENINDQFYTLTEKIMPLLVEVRIETAESTGYFEALKNKLLFWDTRGGKKECKLAIDLVNVQPLIDNPKDVIGIYCLQGTCSEDEKVFLYRNDTREIDPYLEQVKDASKKGSYLISGSGNKQSLSYKINSIIIGH